MYTVQEEEVIRMKIGNSSPMLDYMGSDEEKFARMKALGYDAIEGDLSKTPMNIFRNTADMEEHCKNVRNLADRYGIEIYQVHGPLQCDDRTEESRKRVWEYFHRAVYGCYLLGAKFLVVHPRLPYGFGDAPELDPEFTEKLTTQLLQELIPECEQYGIVLCLENMPFPTYRISSMEKTLEIVKKIDSPNVKVCLDTGHVNTLGQNLGDAVRLCGPYLQALHIHDNDGADDQHLLPYQGTADWESFVKALAEIDYSGVVMLETPGSVTEHMTEDARLLAESETVSVAGNLAKAIEKERRKNKHGSKNAL